MDKERLKKKWEEWKPKLAFLKPWDMENDFEDDLEIREMHLGSVSAKKNPARIRRNRRLRMALLILGVILVAAGFFFYNQYHSFESYVIISSAENLDIVGTEYTMAGDMVVKYSQDGVFCTNSRSEIKWSVPYSMQSPILDQYKETMVIAEQQGKQVYVLNADGLLGNFETQLPILKARVSKQGVVALVLEDDDITWIELYNYAGEELVKIKTTLQDSGYPLDIAIKPDASGMIVSYLGVYQGTIGSRIACYDFSSADAEDTHLTGTLEYPERVFPEVYYADASTPVALCDTGFIVLKNSDKPEVKEEITFEKEIVSSFHDENYVGFIFLNEATDCRYRIELYRYNGQKTMEKEVDSEYTEVKMDQGEILMYDSKNCTVFTISGTVRFCSDYEKQVDYFAGISGFRKYLVITNDSMDRIKIS